MNVKEEQNTSVQTFKQNDCKDNRRFIMISLRLPIQNISHAVILKHVYCTTEIRLGHLHVLIASFTLTKIVKNSHVP